MHIVIVGPGALGSLLTARLALYLAGPGGRRAGNDVQVSLLDYKPPRAQILARGGLFFETATGVQHCSPQVTSDPAVCTGADILFLCVKATVLGPALDRLSPYFSSAQMLLGMQNGIAHLEPLAATPCIVGVGVTTEGATLLAPGRVRHGGAGLTRLGLLSPASSEATALLGRLAALLSAAGLPAQVVTDPRKHVWVKLFVNAGINALTALMDCPNGALLDSVRARERMVLAVREAEAVARAAGIVIDDDPVASTFRVCESTKNNISSMLQDIRNQRKTEIDAINGAVVAAGRKMGIPTPVNEELVRQVRELESAWAGGGAQC